MKIQALQVGSIGTNCYILCDEAAKVCAVIDPGAEPELILSAAEKLDCTVDKILLTHGHYDHTGAVAALLEIKVTKVMQVRTAAVRDIFTERQTLRGQY